MSNHSRTKRQPTDNFRYQYDQPKPDYRQYDKPVALTDNHRRYHSLLKNPAIHYVVADGFAGTSKSICAVYYGVQAVLHGKAKGLYFVRANEGIGKGVGFYKGTEREKLTPLMEQLLTYASSFFNMSVDELIDNGLVHLQNLNFLQGKDLSNYWLIVDEAQLIEPEAMYCIATRGAEKTVLIGDCRPEQCVNKRIKSGKDGLSYLLHYLGDLPIVGTVSMTEEEDIVRQQFLKPIILRLTGSLEEWKTKVIKGES